MFKTIKNNVVAEITEKKSKFIANIFYVESEAEAEKKIAEIRKKYYDARHNCYAYKIDEENISRFSDDGEPSGTAGLPILSIIEGNNLNNVLVIVTRYFGGILLGTGGLVRAYSDATIKALENAELVNITYGKVVRYEVEYKELEKIKYYLKNENINIFNIEYQEKIFIDIEVTEEEFDKINQNINNKSINIKFIREIENRYIKR